MADTTIESLQIEVSALSTSAVASLKELRGTLDALKGVCRGGCGLKSIVQPLQDVNNAVRGLDNASAAKLSSLVKALSGLQGIGKINIPAHLSDRIVELGLAVNSLGAGLDGSTQSKLSSLAQAFEAMKGIKEVKISASIGKGIGEISTALALMPDGMGEKLTSIGTGLAALQGVESLKISSTLGKELMNVAIGAEELSKLDLSNLEVLAESIALLDGAKISSTLNTQIEKLSKTAETLQGQDFSGFTRLSDSLTPLVSQLTAMNGTLPNVASNIRTVANASNRLATANRATSESTFNLFAGLMVAYRGVKRLGTAIAKFIDKSNSYIEDFNLFNASMGQYAESAQEYAEKVGSLMGIDPGKWMRNQGVFQTLATGFGVASDRAYIMSKNLTQLGYDLSSFFNIAVDGEGGSMQKLQAGISGELEPLRRLGFDLSQARLKAVALSLGIDQTFNSMTQAQKAQLRYYAIMTQVTTAQGDMARTLDTPANQLRILKAQTEQAARALGNIFIPVLNQILPYAIAAANAVRLVANAIANLFGFTLPEIDYSGLTGASSAVDDLDSGITSATGSAKKLKELLADWDELNIIQSESGGSGSGGSSAYNPDDWTWELPEYDFLGDLVKTRADSILAEWKPVIEWITDHLTEIGSLVAGIGTAILEWNLAKKFMPDLKKSSRLFSNLLKGVAALAVEAITIGLNVHFTTDFLQNGNLGSLLGGTVTDIAGSSLVGKIIGSMFTDKKLGKTVGTITTGISFVINAGVTLGLSMDDIKANGFNEKNITTLVKGAFEGAVGLYFIGDKLIEHFFGPTTTGDKAAIAGAAITIAAGIGLSFGLMADAANQEDNGKAALEIAGSGVTSFMTAALAGYEVTKMTGNKKYGYAVAGVTLGIDAAVTSLSLFNQLSKEGWTGKEDQWAMVIKTVLETAAAGAAIGVMIGNPVAGGAIGATIGIALTAGIILSNLNVTKNNYAELDWGDVELEAADLENYVKESFFTRNIDATITIVKGNIKETEDLRNDLNSQIASLGMSLNKLKLKSQIDQGDDELKNLKDQITGEGGIIPTLNEYLSKSENMLSANVHVVPLHDDKGNDISGQFLQDMTAADSSISAMATKLGDEISNLITEGYEKGLDDRKHAWLNELTDILTDLTNAVTMGEASAKFSLGVQNILELNKDSFDKVFDEYVELKESLKQEITDIWDSTYAQAKGREAGLLEAMKAELKLNGESEEYWRLKKQHDELQAKNIELWENRQRDISSAVAQYSMPGFQLLSQAYMERFHISEDMIADPKNKKQIWIQNNMALSNVQNFQESFWKSLVEGDESSTNALAGQFKITLQQILKRTLGQDQYDTLYKGYLKGLFDWGDLFDEDSIEELKKRMMPQFDDPILQQEAEQKWNDLFDSFRMRTKYADEDFTVPTPDTTDASEAITDLAATVTGGVNTIREALGLLDGTSISITGSVNFPKLPFFKWGGFAAAGGEFDTGELFVAREAGPELIGSIGRRTTVANNNDIQGGISSGVREANSEQNELLRQQNQYLRVIAAKTGRMKIEPSTALARTVKRSEEMRLESEGV